MESETTATFQQSRSEFAEIAKFLIKELIDSMTNLEAHVKFHPDPEHDKRTTREPYVEFWRPFSQLFNTTRHSVRNKELINAIDLWLQKIVYRNETKEEDFDIGISFAKQYLNEMFKIGLLDLNVTEPEDFPFEDIIRDITAEYNRTAILQSDISRSKRDIHEDAFMDIEKDEDDDNIIVNPDDEEEEYDMFAAQD
jgi:hypothetical protein